MSMDYTDTFVLCGRVPRDAAIANATTLLDIIFSKSFNFKVLHAQIRVNATATSATQSFKVQLSDAAGAFGTPTDLAAFTITSSAPLITETAEVRVADGSTDVAANGLRCVRIVHIATSTDATLDYSYAVTCTGVGY